MRSKRDQLEIISDILDLVEKGHTTKSALMKDANLSFTILRKYTDYLISKGYLEETENGYRITLEGEKVLEKLRRVRELEFKLAELINELSEEL